MAVAAAVSQGLHLGAQEEAGVTPGEQQVPPKADDGRPVDTPLPAATGARYAAQPRSPLCQNTMSNMRIEEQVLCECTHCNVAAYVHTLHGTTPHEAEICSSTSGSLLPCECTPVIILWHV